MAFEWDEAKRLNNIAERGIDFEDVVQIFDGPVIESEDDREEYGEVRIRALGQLDNEFYIVVYTWRGQNRRIISAWKVDEDGKRRYQAILSRRT